MRRKYLTPLLEKVVRVCGAVCEIHRAVQVTLLLEKHIFFRLVFRVRVFVSGGPTGFDGEVEKIDIVVRFRNHDVKSLIVVRFDLNAHKSL